MYAVKAVQKQETLLQKVAETLEAPLEKLDKTVEHILNRTQRSQHGK